ncbi:hypothetical protein BJF79_39960 [Actinomadura sp. CNU-125]|uniref:hypothetical protein n=1 Tax=Actinomadura sp. CNU-125 TaxID=1904961 RepID=UPI00095D0E2F|nr:hypothetical protein [Actinomadura sp. CNU-125]OLT30010.1 hypothetical protein BJF79_39960 [Actinomadura sp. CNU-125]
MTVPPGRGGGDDEGLRGERSDARTGAAARPGAAGSGTLITGTPIGTTPVGTTDGRGGDG